MPSPCKRTPVTFKCIPASESASQFPSPILLEFCAVGQEQESWEENVYTSDRVELDFIASPTSMVEGWPKGHTFILRTTGTGAPARLLGLACVMCLLFTKDSTALEERELVG